jgi:hypothetical protein
VPSQTDHVLADTKGTYAKTVTTAGLYDFFSKPDIAQLVKGNRDKELVGQFIGWNSGLKELRELSERVNAKSRWMSPDGADAKTGLERARERLSERHDSFQTTLVALTEMTTAPVPDSQEIRVLTAELNSVERELETVKSDVRALTQLTQQEAKMSVSDRIATQVAQAKTRATSAQHEQVEQPAQRTRLEDQEHDRAQKEQGDGAQTGVADAGEDQVNDRDGGKDPDDSAPKTLAARLAERRAALSRDSDGRDTDGPTHGRTR